MEAEVARIIRRTLKHGAGLRYLAGMNATNAVLTAKQQRFCQEPAHAAPPLSRRNEVPVHDGEYHQLLRPDVRFGSKADIQRYPLQCPLLGGKLTFAFGARL